MGGVTAFSGQPVAGGSARGEAVAADVPPSFWGGFDPETGIIIDRRHPLAGQSATGRVLVIRQAGIMLGKRRPSRGNSQRHRSRGDRDLSPRSGDRSWLHPRRRALRLPPAAARHFRSGTPADRNGRCDRNR